MNYLAENWIGIPRKETKKNIIIYLACKQSEGFKQWYENKFLKWEYELIDWDTLEVLNESIAQLERELLE